MSNHLESLERKPNVGLWGESFDSYILCLFAAGQLEGDGCRPGGRDVTGSWST